MFSGSFFDLALQVIRSWQVIAVTVAIVIYVFLINYVADIYHRRRVRPPKPNKRDVMAEPEAEAGGDDSSSSDNDELGLEEE